MAREAGTDMIPETKTQWIERRVHELEALSHHRCQIENGCALVAHGLLKVVVELIAMLEADRLFPEPARHPRPDDADRP